MSLDKGYVPIEYLKKAAELVRDMKRLSYEHMAITAGATVLDIGCGPGVDTAELAQRVGGNGKVIGIDTDEAMLAEAEKVCSGQPGKAQIEHRLGSALDLPLADNVADACRAERLLQVLSPDTEQVVLREMVRVTRPGARVVLVDADWGSASVDFSDPELERRLMTFFALQMRPNGLAGRRLYALCREQQLEDIRIDVVPLVQHRFDDTPFGDWLCNTATAEGIMDASQAQWWQQELRQREAQQRFHACVNMVIVSGRTP